MSYLMIRGGRGVQNQMHTMTWNLDPSLTRWLLLTEMRIFSKMRIIWGQNLSEILVGLRGEAASIWQNSAIFCLNLLER